MIVFSEIEINCYLLDTLRCREKVHDNKEISCGNSKPCCESQITTC